MTLWFRLIAHLLVTLAWLARPGGVRAVVAESLAVKHQLLIMKRSQRRGPTLTGWDRLILGFCTLLVSPRRLGKIAVILKTSTLLRLHRALVKRKYQLLYGVKRRCRSGPKGPSRELIDAVVEMKRRNPYFGCRKIAEQIASAFGIEINKDVVRRILIRYYRPAPSGAGPSWLAAIGHAKDSLWSVDLFRCESILLKSYWVMAVMDVYTRRIIGFGVGAANLDGIQVCRMFNRAIARQTLPKHLSSDNDPLFRFPLAGEPSGTRGRRDQDRSRHAPLACFRRATDRDNTARVSRPDTVLGPRRSRAQAGSLPGVLQPVSLSHRTGRAHAGSEERCTFDSNRTPRFV